MESLLKTPAFTSACVPAGRISSLYHYPENQEIIISISDGQFLLLRPIRTEDKARLRKLFEELSNHELRLRFLHALNTIPEKQLSQLARIESGRQMIFVLEGTGVNEHELFGHVQIIFGLQPEQAEFSILVHRDLRCMGIGRVLMDHIISYARRAGIKEIFGESLLENKAMLKLAKTLHFSFLDSGDPESVIMSMKL